MLITFKTKVGPNITMFGDVATRLLELMGQSGAVPGAIQGGDVGAALARLKSAIGPAPAAPAAPKDAEAEPPVALYRRALPLIDLLERAAKAGADVIWEKG